jgi:hypothetical protein
MTKTTASGYSHLIIKPTTQLTIKPRTLFPDVSRRDGLRRGGDSRQQATEKAPAAAPESTPEPEEKQVPLRGPSEHLQRVRLRERRLQPKPGANVIKLFLAVIYGFS